MSAIIATIENDKKKWSAAPLGPKVRAFLSLTSDYDTGTEPVSLDGPAAEEFAAFLVEFSRTKGGLASDAELGDLLDELVAMDQPKAALGLAAAYPERLDAGDFRVQLSLGVAAMLAGDHDEAETRLRAAQAILPDEPAPYVNLVQILAAQARHDEATVWCLAGLDAERNNPRLWSLLADLWEPKFGEFLPEELQRFAAKKDAWAGLSLAANMTATGDRYHKMNLLERLYFQGERDHEFLVEFTAALGVAGELQRIPTIVWQAEQATAKGVPWQLHVHAAQAQLGMGQAAECKLHIEKARLDPRLPEGVPAMLDELAHEADEVARGEAPTLH